MRKNAQTSMLLIFLVLFGVLGFLNYPHFQIRSQIKARVQDEISKANSYQTEALENAIWTRIRKWNNIIDRNDISATTYHTSDGEVLEVRVKYAPSLNFGFTSALVSMDIVATKNI